jgi:hypothetical protein
VQISETIVPFSFRDSIHDNIGNADGNLVDEVVNRLAVTALGDMTSEIVIFKLPWHLAAE